MPEIVLNHGPSWPIMASSATTPIEPPPPGVTPDFEGRSSVQNTLLIVYPFFLSLSTAFLGLRLYTVLRIIRRFGLDEVLIICAWLLSVAFTTLTLLCVTKGGFGNHMWNVSVDQYNYSIALISGISVTYMATTVFTKLALLVFFHRINQNVNFRRLIYLVAALLVFVHCMLWGFELFHDACKPTRRDDVCQAKIAIVQVTFNLFGDVVLILMPVSTIAALRVPLRQKLIIYAILALGSSAIVVSIVRAVYIEDLIRRDPDVFWSEGRVAIWSCVEVNLGIVCNCLVLLRPFVYRHIPWLVGQRSGPPRHRRWPRRTALASRSIGGHAFHPWHAGRHDDDDDEDKDDERTGGRCNVSCPNSGAGSPPKKCARGVLVESMVAVEYQEKEVRARSLEDEEEGVKAEQGAEEPRQRNAVSVIVVGGGDTAGPQSAPATTLEAVV